MSRMDILGPAGVQVAEMNPAPEPPAAAQSSSQISSSGPFNAPQMEGLHSYKAEGGNGFAAHGRNDHVKLSVPAHPQSQPRGSTGVTMTSDTIRNSPDKGVEQKDELYVLVTENRPDSPSSRTTSNNVAQMGNAEPSQVQIGEREPPLHSPVPSTVTVQDEEVTAESISDEEAGTSCQPTPALSLEGIKVDETSDLSDPDFDDEPCQEEQSGDDIDPGGEPECLHDHQEEEGEGAVCLADVGGASIVLHDWGGVPNNHQAKCEGVKDYPGEEEHMDLEEAAVVSAGADGASFLLLQTPLGVSSHKPGWSNVQKDHPGEGHAIVEEGAVGPADVGGVRLLLHDSGGVSNHQAQYADSGRAEGPDTNNRQVPSTSLTETSVDGIGSRPYPPSLPAQPGSQLQVVGYAVLEGEEWDINDPVPDPDPDQPLEVCTCVYQEMAAGRSD